MKICPSVGKSICTGFRFRAQAWAATSRLWPQWAREGEISRGNGSCGSLPQSNKLMAWFAGQISNTDTCISLPISFPELGLKYMYIQEHLLSWKPLEAYNYFQNDFVRAVLSMVSSREINSHDITLNQLPLGHKMVLSPWISIMNQYHESAFYANCAST